ncbi:MAG: hypothetical protein EB078_00475 [Proteobacteria bacterium]|nr:hypothetical protein [Pseudomonadota bacterium]NDC23179.1 hypothetical protein [Pseudomonadota bacterium]NDD03354.1 hypothetical protein [Pseudomonadota bacterium]NDG26245.1 hypothetical protein [Pseudomonadota bacterium]
MLLRGDFWKRPATLKPYVLKIKDGFLLGLALAPEKGAPCSNCVRLWLKQRNIVAQHSTLSELTIRRDLITELLAENSAHTIYEISLDGTAIKMESLVFPHPQCTCDRGNYLPPESLSKNTNYAFSPLYQIFCTRFGTPDGNLWLTRVTGDCPLSERPLTVFAVEKDKEVSRKKAVDEWMKKATLADLPKRMKRGELIASEVLQTGDLELLKPSSQREVETAAMGAGKDKEEATLNALVELAKVTTLRRYSNTMKNPMLVVGANNWIRSKVPFFLLQQYDLHLLFYPNSTQAWVVGLGAFSRQRTDEKPVFVFAAHTDAKQALEELFFKILEALKPEEQIAGDPVLKSERGGPHTSKLNMWWTHWIYRCPKIALKDILHLEPYPRKLQNWRDYYRDGQDKVSVLSVNSPYLPSQIRTIVKVQSVLRDNVSSVRNINGIGTWSDFSDALA